MVDRARYRLRSRIDGFSLLEVLVAFVLLALVLGALLRVFGQGLAHAAIAEEYAKAALLAESHLASVGRQETLQPGIRRGTFDDRFRWEMQLVPHEEDVASNVPATLLRIDLTVFWPSGSRQRQLTLTTLRLMRWR